MINAEIHKNELRTLFKLKKLQDCALRKDNGSFGNCYNIGCKNCMFNDKEGCTYARIKWMLSEYKEPIKLSRLEYEILKWSEKGGYKFIVRSPSDNLIAYNSAPRKAFNSWVSENDFNGLVSENKYKMLWSFNELFKFVKWEDEKPTSIKEVLENCAVENIKEE